MTEGYAAMLVVVVVVVGVEELIGIRWTQRFKGACEYIRERTAEHQSTENRRK